MKKLILLALLSTTIFAKDGKMHVYQPPTSTCPKSWFTDMEKVSDEINVVTMMNVKSLKKDIGIPKEIQSCNTTLMDDYVFEGNVPSLAIKDFLKDVPKNAIGLALPAYENDKKKKRVFIVYEDKSYELFGYYK